MMHFNGQFLWNMLFEMKLIDFMSEENLKMYLGKKCECLQLSRINWILYAINFFPFKHNGTFTKYKFLSLFFFESIEFPCISLKSVWFLFVLGFFFTILSEKYRMLFWSTHSVRPYRIMQTNVLANPVCKHVHVLLHLPSNRVK